MHASLEVDGRPEQLCSLGLSEMSLSSARSAMKRHDYLLRVAKAELIVRLSGAYETWVADSKLDDKRCGAPVDELAEAGYPPLAQLVDSAELSELVLGDYLLRELFAALCPTNSSALVYWLDTVDRCAVEGDCVTFCGACYSSTRGLPTER